MIKSNKFKVLYVLLLFLLSMAITSKAKSEACSSKFYCLHSSMFGNVYPQYTNLTGLVKNYTRDKGYCGAASAAMALSYMQKGNMAKSALEVLNFPSKNVANAIYYAGNLIGTSWDLGGTKESAHFTLFNKIATTEKSLATSTSPISTQHIIKEYHKVKPVQTLSVRFGKSLICKFVGKVKNCTINYQGAHVVNVRGYENGKVQVWDPWNRIYNIEIVAGVPKVQGIRTYGMMETYASRGLEVGMLSSYFPNN